MRRLAAVVLVGVLCLSTGFTQQTAEAPRLVLVLVIDQMRPDFLDRFSPLYRGGLKQLNDRAAIFTNAHYRHAATETGPGHSVILTGSLPRHSGIVGNDWYDPYLKKVVNVIDDPVHVSIGGEGRSASPANMLTFTVGDVLKRSRGGRSRVVGVATKDRSAILMGGRRGDAAYWFENRGGNFVTSSYYMPAAPAWLNAWNAKRMPDRYAQRTWTRVIDDPALYEQYAGKDAVEGERDRKDITFPHVFMAAPPSAEYYTQLRRTPYIDELVLEFSLEALAQHRLGEDDDTDILAIGLSATDGIGHAWGPDSHEQMDHMLRLDQMLERLFAEIDRRVGLDRTIVVLSSDHGARPLPEISQKRGIRAQRVAPAVLRTAVEHAFAARYPNAKGLIEHFATDIYLDEEVMRTNRLDRTAVERTAIDALMATGLVERVFTHADLSGGTHSDDPLLALFRNAFFAPRSPHLTVMAKRDVYLNAAAGGTGHGSVYDFDRHVPVMFMAPGIAAGRYSAPSGPEDIAPTLAHMLKLDLPREREARLLAEMMKR